MTEHLREDREIPGLGKAEKNNKLKKCRCHVKGKNKKEPKCADVN